LGYRPTENFPPKQRRVGSDSTIFSSSGTDETETVFTLPVIALVLITILNDGTIITICRDFVIPASRPQSWNLPEIFTLSSGLGALLILENLLMLLMGFNSGSGHHSGSHCGQSRGDYPSGSDINPSKCDGFLASVFGDSEKGTMSYRQVKSLMYLSVSISSFLTVYAARVRGPFYELRPGSLLFSASVFSWIITTLFSAFADDISDDLYMEGLEAKTIFFVWAWCIGFFLIQDLVVKRAVYYTYDKLNKKDDDEYEERREEMVRSQLIEEEQKVQRSTIVGSKHSQSIISRETLSSSILNSASLRSRASLFGSIVNSQSIHRSIHFHPSLGVNGVDDRGVGGGDDGGAVTELTFRMGQVEQRVESLEMAVQEIHEDEEKRDL